MAKFDAAKFLCARREASCDARDARAGAVSAHHGSAGLRSLRPAELSHEVLHQRAVRRGAQGGHPRSAGRADSIEYYGMTEGGGTCVLLAHEYPGQAAHRRPARAGSRHPSDRRSRPRSAARRDRRGRRALTGRDDERLPQPARQDRGSRVVRQRTAIASFARATSGASTRTASSRCMDRRKDMIISGGFNIYPSDLEAVLLRARSGQRSGRRRRAIA